MSDYFEPTCDLCAKLKASVDTGRQANYRLDGGRWTIVDAEVIPKPAGDIGQWVVKVYMSGTSGVVRSSSGVIVTGISGTPNFNIEFSLVWRGTEWKVVGGRLYRP
ncbi:MAG: hypothetical protein JO147_10035 [Actinobacteria bacterium]|nr:hypothetical protein [Actinomycetota bacterium]